MAMKKKKPAKKKKFIEMTLWDVILSFPDVSNPQPYKGKTYYRTDVLFDKGHPSLKALRENIKAVYTNAFGADESEWPETEKPHIMNGDEREDQPGYKGRRYITVKTQQPVPVVGLDGKKMNEKLVKGGMFANVAVSVAHWEFDGDEGVTIYLNGIQIDTDKEALKFGGGRSVKAMFARDDDEDEDSEDFDDEDESEDDEEEEEAPRKKKKPSRDADEDEEDEAPRKKKKPARNFDDEDEEDEDDKPRKKKKPARSRDFDEDDEE